MANILVIYHANSQYPPRVSTYDHLYAFQRYAQGHSCYYVNLAVRRIPWYLYRIKFDLIIFHTLFLIERWSPNSFKRMLRLAKHLKKHPATKIAFPQDEFLYTDAICNFINDFNIDHVFSVAPESEWAKIYHTVNFQRVKFHYVLTGYLETNTIQRIARIVANTPHRDIDIGYRAFQAPPWLGRFGFLKTEIATIFQKTGRTHNLVTNISTDKKDTFLGDQWYAFLARCKYTIGVEGGASMLDRDGTIRQKTDRYLAQRPQASFQETEAACFPNQDQSLKLFAISPRHLEACATRTCQILIEGDYNQVIFPGKHYIELKRDFSNLNEVVTLIQNDTLREQLTENAYRDIVASGNFTYQSFVDYVLDQSLCSKNKPALHHRHNNLGYRWQTFVDRQSWKAVALHAYLITPLKRRIYDTLVTLLSLPRLEKLIQRLSQ